MFALRRFKEMLIVVVSCYAIGVLLAVVREWKSGVGVPRSVYSGQVSNDNLLAVVVPIYDGDENSAMTALSKWPTTCYDNTLKGVDLVIYKAEALADADDLPHVPRRTSRCFRQTKIIGANLLPKDNVYPKGASVMFYKMFLDAEVAHFLEEYDALAVMEWDVLVAHSTSFSRLYDAAFNSEPFWVKGSTLGGTEFHQTAHIRDMWHILGHLNGNAIYNNTDAAFTQFVNYTLTRWEYSYSYDVALWATISDFPYSWLLWQKYSSHFVATKLISNVGFFDVSNRHVEEAISQQTLFIHGNTLSGGNSARLISEIPPPTHNITGDCIGRCDLAAQKHERTAGVSTFCDDSCSPGWSSAGPRFGGHNCGVGAASQYGSTCRLCYTNQEDALAADRSLASSSSDPLMRDAHVVMCETGHPPPALRCSVACQNTDDTVCDYRCGSGRYGNLHCNWKGLGETCRLCFRQTQEAYVADKVAMTFGARVIMCDTHEPPVPIVSFSRNGKEEIGSSSDDNAGEASSSSNSSGEDKPEMLSTIDNHADPSRTTHIGTTTRGHMCAFLQGYFELLAETRVSVDSILDFMPGMRVAIATHPRDFHAYHRALGQLPGVKIGNSSNVEYGALNADRICGNGTRMIYYMDAGEVLSRTFTKKDTHTIQGDLIVSYTGADDLPLGTTRRAMGSTAILGFTSPSFVHGNDLILPKEINAQLRALLNAKRDLVAQTNTENGQPGHLVETVYDHLADVANTHRDSATIFVPEVLAALAYSRGGHGMVFLDVREWSRRNLFSKAAIWDIPLLRPRFGCSFDVSPSLKGYLLADAMAKELDGFKTGSTCELGFKSVEISRLGVKAEREFGVDGAEQRMPNLEDYRMSVMYRTFAGDASLFEMSIAGVIAHVSCAVEVVVVVVEADIALFEAIVDQFRSTAPFPIHVVGEPELMNGHIQQKYSKLRADLYTQGDYILHMDSDVVIFEDVTYSHVFHLEKPVLPFRRYRKEEGDPELKATTCWQLGTSRAIGEDVYHEFSVFNTHVYPRSMYPAARAFIEQHHGMPFVDFMATRQGSCNAHLRDILKWTLDERGVMFSDFNYIGAYLWYHMHDAVHWLAIDPYDTEPDDWRPDVSKFAWVCQANGRRAPQDPAGMEQYVADYRMVRSIDQCEIVKNHWEQREMLIPETRTKIDTNSERWMSR
ncbi:unnamed protein product [Ectocarpus sp. 4 AP-2014]